jgi:putative ABC transport system permease protein
MALSPSKMFFRLLLRSATVRRGRTFTALFAIAVAATLATALMNLYGDIEAKLSGDFRKFGANVIVTAPDGMSVDEIASLQTKLGPQAVVMPEAYAIAKTADGKQVVVGGVEWEKARALNSYWAVTKWPEASDEILVGTRAAATRSLEFNGITLDVRPVGEIRTGGDEDSRIYVSLAQFQAWTGLKPTVVEAAIPGSPSEVNAMIARLKSEWPTTVSVQPVRQIVEGETLVLGKSRFILLLSTLAITITVALCVLATLTASVLERRKDYAVMKALGSSQGSVNAIFLGETISLAIIGAIIGFVAGGGLAMWIGQSNFHTRVALRFNVFPYVLAGCIVVAAVSGIVPLSILQKTQPATMLKGE